jgi:PAS domain S-box-containing protein
MPLHRRGFDDADLALATIGLDGHFEELNPAFSELVGYSEEDFRVASWPPVADRANFRRHRRQMQDLVAGRLESAEVSTGYVHAQGLLVPVVGRISLVREDGEPSHLLLEAGVPEGLRP